MVGKFLQDFFVPRIKFLAEATKRIIAIDKCNKALDRLLKLEQEENFPFMCPNCSGLMKVSREDPYGGCCYHCNTTLMELFFGPQKIFVVVDGGGVSWWVSAKSEEEAIDEVVDTEMFHGIDRLSNGCWTEVYEMAAEEVTSKEASKLDYSEGYNRKSSIWNEFSRDSSSRVIACSEW